MKIELNVTIPDYNLSLVKREDLTDITKLAGHLFFTSCDMTNFGHVKVGTVEVEVELLPPDEIVGNAVVALRAKAAEIRAKATAEVTALEGKAQQLLAIENAA